MKNHNKDDNGARHGVINWPVSPTAHEAQLKKEEVNKNSVKRSLILKIAREIVDLERQIDSSMAACHRQRGE